jgi:hypothetical protein
VVAGDGGHWAGEGVVAGGDGETRNGGSKEDLKRSRGVG